MPNIGSRAGRTSGRNGGDTRADVSSEGFAFAPGDIDRCAATIDFDPASLVLTAYGCLLPRSAGSSTRVLVSLADHGLTPSALAARLFLGPAGDTAEFLFDALDGAAEGAEPARLAEDLVAARLGAGRRALLDVGLPPGSVRGFVLIGRTAGFAFLCPSPAHAPSIDTARRQAYSAFAPIETQATSAVAGAGCSWRAVKAISSAPVLARTSSSQSATSAWTSAFCWARAFERRKPTLYMGNAPVCSHGCRMFRRRHRVISTRKHPPLSTLRQMSDMGVDTE